MVSVLRKGITRRRKTIDSKTRPENAEELVQEFRDIVMTYLEDHGWPLLNGDQTFVLWELTPNYTYDEKGSKQINTQTSRGKPKLGATVTLLITSTGLKGKAEIIFSGLVQDGRTLREIQDEAPDNVRVSNFQAQLKLINKTNI